MSSIGEDSGSAVALAEKILKMCEKGERLVFFKGNLARDTMCETLTSGGLLVEQLVVYETTESKHLKEDLSVIQPPDWVVLFSPSGARAALPLLQGFAKERPFKVVAIGEEAMWYGHHHPFSPQAQPQERRCCVWASRSLELLRNLLQMPCVLSSEMEWLAEEVVDTPSCQLTFDLPKFYTWTDENFVSEKNCLYQQNEESKGKRGS